MFKTTDQNSPEIYIVSKGILENDKNDTVFIQHFFLRIYFSHQFQFNILWNKI